MIICRLFVAYIFFAGSEDTNHDARCFPHATAGMVHQVELVYSSSKGGFQLPAFVLKIDAQ
jgi:hypothetical protein